MSLTIKLNKVYINKSIASQVRFFDTDTSIECVCNVTFRDCVQTRILSKFKNNNPARLKYINDTDELVSSENKLVVFKLGSDLKYGDFLLFECFVSKYGKIFNKPFGVYKMLLESLNENENFIEIDDYLINPKTNLTIKEKIVFNIRFLKPIFDKSGRVKEYENENVKSFTDVEQDLLELDEFEFMKSDPNMSIKMINTSELSKQYLENKKKMSSFKITNAIGKATFSLAQVAYNPNSILNDDILIDNEDLIKLNEQPLLISDLKDILPQILKKRQKFKTTSWQIRVQLIELKHLLGNNENVYCVVSIGDQVFKSSIKSIENLKFNEVFTSKIDNKIPQKVFNLIISISVYFKNLIKSDSFIGKFEIDVGTVYNHPNHEFYHKWGSIMSSEDANSGGSGSSGGGFAGMSNPKGFVKCDISVLAKGDKNKVHKEEAEKDDEIDNNMILPYELENPRILVELTVRLYSADVLFKNRITKYDKLKIQFKNLTKNIPWSDSEEQSLLTNNVNQQTEHTILNLEDLSEDLNLFVKITFCGMTRRTSSIKSRSKPVWDESLKFIFLYPSLIRLFKIELCSEETFGEKVLATEYLDIDTISSYSSAYYYPTLGPCKIDMYSEPENLRFCPNNSTNLNFDIFDLFDFDLKNFKKRIENSNKINDRVYMPVNGSSPGGGDYVARLKIGIESQKYDYLKKKKKNDSIQSSLDLNLCNQEKTFTLFVLISDVTMIDQRYQSDLSFQLCLGTCGYESLNQIDLTSNKLPLNFTKQQNAIRLSSKMPFYLPFEKTKPCMCLKFKIEDLRYFMYCKNMIQNTLNSLTDEIKKSFCDLSSKHDYKNYQREILMMKSYIKNIFLKNEFITQLEQKRMQQLVKELDNMIDNFQSISNAQSSFKKPYLIKIKNCIDKCYDYISEPLSLFPDVNLWLLSNKEPIGICTIKSNDIIWSKDNFERGFICDQMIYTDIKSLNPNDFQKPLFENVARIRVYMWLGLKEETDEIFKGLNDDYGLSENYLNNIFLPTYIFYNSRKSFRLMAHLYQGRDLLGLDSTGLSDPYVKLTVGNQSVYSNVIIQTNNPKWDSTLIISEINLYSSFHNIESNPPEIIMEVFDQDRLGKDELIGKCYLKPTVQNDSNKVIPKLSWYNILNGYESSGDILASFQLILDSSITKNQTNSVSNQTQSIPNEIKPITSSHTIEILFWGLRNVKMNNSVFFAGEKIRITIQIGDSTIHSNSIDKFMSNDNFLIIHKKQNIDLPEENEYKPHLNIKCFCENSLGKQQLIGSYTVKSINQYLKDLSYLKEKYKICKYLSTSFFINSIRNEIYSLKKKDCEKINSFNRFNSGYYERAEDKKEENKTEVINYKYQDISSEMSRFETEYLDWWSKYYKTIEAEENDDLFQDDEKNKNEDVVIDSTQTKSTKKHNKFKRNKIKKLNKKKKRIKKNILIKKKEDTKIENLKDNSNSSEQTENLKNVQISNPIDIEKIEIFDCELEKVEKFKESFDMLDTYPLFKGKNQPNNYESIQCHFKGKFLIYKEDLPLLEAFDNSIMKRYGGFLNLSPPNTLVPVKVRIYIIKALNINSIRDSGICDPYLSIQIGDKLIEDTENTKVNTLEPVFGRMYEFDLKFPYDSQATISIKDWGLLGNKGLIGRTIVDLEDRFYSSCYATCGLSKHYETSGYNEWRDYLSPTIILSRMCKKWRLKLPEYKHNSVVITNIDNLTKEYKYEDMNDLNTNQNHQKKNLKNRNSDSNNLISPTVIDPKIMNEQLALMVLNDWYHITGTYLVPEHIERRSLYNPESPDLEQGKIEMWIDMFPLEETTKTSQKYYQIPKHVDISPRKPKKFQLRVIIFNTEEVTLDDENPLTGEKSSDIYIKGILCDKVDESQRTDTHFRSLNGEGNFNWRFIFDFEFLPGENLIIYKTKEHTFSLSTIEKKTEPVINLECWDADLVSADDLLGTLKLNLCNMVKGAKSSKNCKLSMIKNKNSTKINLFHEKYHRGWWPFSVYDSSRNMRLTGKLEAEFQLLTEQQALERPAGLGRNEPDPLPEPNRPQDSFAWFLSPLRTFKYVIWKNHKCLIIQIFVFILLFMFILIFILQLPSHIIQKTISFFG